MSNAPSEQASPQGKSGLRSMKSGEILFNDGEHADSLYIIQKGQIRLFKPKGKGFIEIGVLRAGEVIGEMAFFDEDGSGRKRSCSASALTGTEIIEISFVAFGKTMQTLNPWFKTIINTLAKRLRKANTRIKELEDNQAAVSYSGKTAGYEFVKPIEVMKILGTIFLVFKAHAENAATGMMITRKTLELYSSDMYHIMDAKMESVLSVLAYLGWVSLTEENIESKHLDMIRQTFIYYNGERHLPQDKKLKISDNAESLMSLMIQAGPKIMNIPNLKIDEDAPPKFTKYYMLQPILSELKSKNLPVRPDSLDDGRNVGLFGEAAMIDGQYYIECDFAKVQKLYPVIRFMNAIKRLNIEKGGME